MANKDMNIAMKFTADVNRAKDNISHFNAGVKESSDIVQEANRKSAESFQKLFYAQSEAWQKVHVDTLWADYIAEQEKQAKAQEAAAKAATAHKKEVDKLRNGLDQLLASIDPTTKGLSRLDALEKKLRDSKKNDVIDSKTFDDYLGKINNQRAALSTVDSLNTGTKKLALNTRTAKRDMVSFLRQLSSGNISAAGNSLFNIGNSTGKLPPLFSAATLSVVAFTAAAYGVYKVISTVLAEQERFNRALISTGNYAGTTAGGLESMSKSVGSINHNYAETRGVIAELAEGGQLSADSINNIATASAYMSAVTGKSAKESIASFKGIQDSVTNWALESNKQYHFMDLATYNRIAALEAQGKTEEAIAVATGKYADTMKSRVEEMKEQLNWLESALDKFKNGVADLGEAIKDELAVNLGLADLNKQIAKLEQSKKQGIYTFFGGSMDWNDSFEKELQALYEKKKLQENDVELEREKTLIQKKSISAQKELTDYWKQNRTEAEKQADAVEKIRKQYEALWGTVEGRKSLELKGVTSVDGKTFQGGQYDTDVKAITDKALKQYNQQLKNKINLQEKTTELSKALYETEQGQYKHASAELKAQVIENAKLLDAHEAEQKALKETEQVAKAAASETERFIKSLESQAEKQTQKTFTSRQALINSQHLTGDNLNRANAANYAITASENKKLNEDLQNQLNSLLLDPASIKISQIDLWYQTVIAQLKANNNTAGIDLIDQLLPLKKAQASIEQIKQQIQAAKTNQAQVISGLITEIEGQSQLVELHKQTALELSKSVPLLEKLAQMPGQVGKDASAALAQLQLEVAQLNKTTDVLTNAFHNGLQNGIQGALQGLADGTNNLSEAIRNLGLSVVSAMTNIASQGLAEMMMGGLDNVANLFSSLFSASSASLTVDTAQSAVAATEMSTAITTATSVGSLELGTSLTTAMATGTLELAGALTTAFATGAMTLSAAITTASAGSSAMSGLAGAASVAAATGGYIRGQGTALSDSIPARLSNGEYVINAAAVRSVGVDYLHAINRRQIRPFATGGLVSNVSTPSAPNIDNSQQRQASQTVLSPVIQQELVLDAGDMVSKGINSVSGGRAMKTFIRANKQTLRQELGIKD